MEKRISFRDFQSIRSVAKAIDPKVRNRNALKKKLEALAEEYKKCDQEISLLEAGIVQTVGFHVTDLVKKVIEPGTDSAGKPTKTTKYLPTDIVTYDENTKQFVVTVPDAANEGTETIVPPSTEGQKGSDFDIDKENSARETVF